VTATFSAPPIVLGANVFGWSVDAGAADALLDAAMDHGLNTIDTADIYSYWAPGNKGGESETIIGDWMRRRGNRARVAIHTKGGAPGAPGDFANGDASAAYLTRAVEASLKRLGTDVIDLYFVHYDDKVTPLEATLSCFQRLMAAGKIKAIGASNYAPDRLTEAMQAAQKHGLPRYSVLQTHYNLVEREPFETELRAICSRHGLHVMAYFALAKGFLSGKYRDKKDAAKSTARGQSAMAYLNPRGLRILAALEAVAETHNASCAAVALAWLAAKPNVSAIASATNESQLDDLAAAAQLRLSPQEAHALDEASRPD
jgi:aryl-alcohol dehydrogenase-like predicted oxidoreductase